MLESILVIAILAVAAIYLVRRWTAQSKGGGCGCGCSGGCSSGCSENYVSKKPPGKQDD